MLRELKHHPYLDALRGWAILGVVLIHAALVSGQGLHVLGYAMAGQRGVQLFYLLSAFTLFFSMEKRTATERRPLLNYVLRRFFRIAPLFYLAIGLGLLVYGLGPRPGAPHGLSVSDIVLGFLFLHGLKPHTINSVAIGGWSIAVETTFYAIFPLLYRQVRTGTQALLWVAGGGFAAWGVSQLYVAAHPCAQCREYATFLWFPIQFPVFCMGLWAFLLLRDGSWPSPATREARRLSCGLLLLAVFLFWFSLPIDNKRLYPSSLAFVPLILGLALHPWLLLVNPAMIFLGRISYSVYLLHFFTFPWVLALFAALERHGLPLVGKSWGYALAVVSILAFSIPLAWASYHLIERPGIALGRWLIERWEEGRKSEKKQPA